MKNGKSTLSIHLVTGIVILSFFLLSGIMDIALEDAAASTNQVLIDDVPSYEWHHGCAPTAGGMIIGYWDSHGFYSLVAGDASYQTAQVNEMIASSEHYLDYSLPLDNMDDYYPLKDKSEMPFGDEHSDNCLADFMKTSQSYHDLYYGGTWFDDIDDGLLGYIQWIYPEVNVTVQNYDWGEFDWDDFCREIDENRPVGLLVDQGGTGEPDHFVTGIGYDGNHNYAFYDTSGSTFSWEDFSGISIGNTYGIDGATFCSLSLPSCVPNIVIIPSEFLVGEQYCISIIVDSRGHPVQGIDFHLYYPFPDFTVDNMTYQNLLGTLPGQVIDISSDDGNGHINIVLARRKGNNATPINGTLYTICLNHTLNPDELADMAQDGLLLKKVCFEWTMKDENLNSLPGGEYRCKNITIIGKCYCRCYDCDMDCDIDLDDLIIFAQSYNNPSNYRQCCDCDDDGDTDLDDLIIFAQHYGESYCTSCTAPPWESWDSPPCWDPWQSW
jgi:hypothetical protein